MIALEEFDFSRRPMVVAHRGSSGLAPENTIAALRKGVEAGADMVEIDVQRTRDEQIIVFHDHVLGRTTNGVGRVDARTLEEIRQLDAGSWMGGEYAGERVPLLNEALEFLHGKAYVNIELKRWAESAGTEFMQDVIDVVVSMEMVGSTLLSSFDHELLRAARDYCDRIPTALILHPDDRTLPSANAHSVGARAIVLSRRQLTRRVVDDARAARLPVGVYTINSADEAAWASERGASALVTNYPEVVVGAVTRLAGMS